MIVLLLKHLVAEDLERDLLQVGATPLKKTFARGIVWQNC